MMIVWGSDEGDWLESKDCWTMEDGAGDVEAG